MVGPTRLSTCEETDFDVQDGHCPIVFEASQQVMLGIGSQQKYPRMGSPAMVSTLFH